MDNNEKLKSIINITFLLAILPAIFYLSAYIYEYVQCGSLNIPVQWISLDTGILLKFGFVIFIKAIFTSISIYILFITILAVTHIKNLSLAYTVFNIGFLIAAYIFLLLSDLLNKEFISFVVIILVIINAYAIYEDLAVRKDTESVKKPVKGFIKASDFFIIILCIITPLFGFFFGIDDLKKRTYYGFILNKHPNQIVLKKYGDYVITSKYDSKANRISDTLSIFKIKEGEEIEIIVKSIHPLNIK